MGGGWRRNAGRVPVCVRHGRPRRCARGTSGGRALAVAALSLAVAALSLAVAAPPPPAAHAHSSAPEADVNQCRRTSGDTSIESIRFTSPDGTYTEGDTIGIGVTASSNLYSSDGYPHLVSHTRIKLETGDVDRFAEYSSHVAGSRQVNYTYTVQEGDTSDDLDYHSARALYWTVDHPLGNQKITFDLLDQAESSFINCLLPGPGQPGSLAASAAIVVDAPPRVQNVTSRVQNVTSDLPDGVYGVGAVIPIKATFNGSVTVNATGGRPSIALDTGGATGRHAEYDAAGSTNRTLLFTYTVRQGDNSADLDYSGIGALHLNGGTIRSTGGGNASLHLPPPGLEGSLGHSKDIAVDTEGPRVSSVSSANASGVYGAASRIDVAVRFDERVYVAGTPLLELATGAGAGRNATYSSGNGSSVLAFNYAVLPGDRAIGLGYTGADALSLGGGAIRDLAGNNASLALPAPGADGSLARSRDIAIHTGGPPFAYSAASGDADGTYRTGGIVAIALNFTHPVEVDGVPRLELATDPVRHALYANGSGTDALEFWYTVQPGDTAADLDHAGGAALSAAGSGAAIRAAQGGAGADLRLPDAGSLASSKDIRILGAPEPAMSVVGEWAFTAPWFGQLRGADVIDIDNKTFAVVATFGSNRLQMFLIRDDGSLARGGDRPDAPFAGYPRLYTPVGVSAFRLNGSTYAVAAVQEQNPIWAGLQVVTLDGAGTGTIGQVGAGDQGGFYPTGSSDRVATFGVDTLELGNETHRKTYAIAAHDENNAVYLVGINASGHVAGIDTASHGANFPRLGAPSDVDAFEIGDKAYAIVASRDSHAVQLIRIHGNGTLEGISWAGDTDTAGPVAGTTAIGPFPNLNHARSVDAFEMGNRTYAIAASHGDRGVQLIRIHGNGTLEGISWARDTDTAGPVAGTTAIGPFPRLNGPRDIDTFKLGAATHAIVAARDDDGVQLIHIHKNGTLEGVGSASDGAPGFDRLGLAASVNAFKLGAAMHAFTTAEGDGVSVIRISPTLVTGVSASSADDTCGIGCGINVTVAFDGPVRVQGPPPFLSLALGGSSGGNGGGAAAQYLRGNATSELVFNYTVRPGELAIGGLDYAGPSALATRGGVLGRVNASADLELPAPGATGSLRAGASAPLVVDTRPAAALSVSSMLPNGTYPLNSTVPLTVAFDKPVSVMGPPPTMLLALGGEGGNDSRAEYVSGSGTRLLEFEYAVRPGDSTGRLDYASAAALSPGSPGGRIVDVDWAPGHAANLTLPAPGDDGSLGRLQEIAIDGIAPSVRGVSSPDRHGAYGAGAAINITVAFSEPVLVKGAPRLALNTDPPANATYRSGNGSETLTFRYVVLDGHGADLLGYADGGSALSADGPGASIRDEAGNNASLRLPPGGLEGGRIAVDTRAPQITGARATSLDTIQVDFDEPVAYAAGPAGPAGWSISGTGTAAGLTVRPSPGASALSDVLELSLGGNLQDTAPDIVLSYDAAAGGIADRANNTLPSNGSIAVSDRIGPGIDSSRIVGDGRIEIRYTEPVSAPADAYSDLVLAGVNRTIDRVTGVDGPAAVHVLEFAPDADPGSAGTVAINRTVVSDGADPPNSMGAGILVQPISDERVLQVESSRITGPDTAVVRYTRAAPAQLGHYADLVVDGTPREIAGLDGGEGAGTGEHTLTFAPGGAPPDAIGSVTIRGVVFGGGNDLTAQLADGQAPEVRSAKAVSRTMIQVVLSEPVVAGGGAAAAPGWSVSGAAAEGIVVLNASGAPQSAPAATLELLLNGSLPGGTAPPAGLTLMYNPSLGGVEDPAGNALASRPAGIVDGIAPEVESSLITGPNKARIAYSEPVWALSGAYVSVIPADDSGPRRVTGLDGNGTRTHTISFGGAGAVPGTEGTLMMDRAAVVDAAGNLLEQGPASLRLRDGQGPAPPPARPGHASVERAAFTARNTATIEYSAALGPPAGHGAGIPVYASVAIRGEDGTRDVARVGGLGTAVHTVVFGGTGVDRNQTGRVELAVNLTGTAAAGGGGDDDDAGMPLRYGAGSINVSAGRTAHAVILSPDRPNRTVAIGPDGFTRTVDARAAGPGARPAVDVSGLAVESEPGSGVFDAVRFPPEPVTLAAEFAAVRFPPNATAAPAPPDGVIFLRALQENERPTLAAAVAAALGYDGAGRLDLGTVVEAAPGRPGSTVTTAIVFDRPVRIFLEGQSGGRAFYVNGSAAAGAAGAEAAIAPIDTVCESDDADVVHAQLGGAGECYLDLQGARGGSAVAAYDGKAIYTYHLTLFGAARADGPDPQIPGGTALQVVSSSITGPDTAVVEYTLPAPARQGHYSDLVVDGTPRGIAGLAGGGTGEHTLTFAPGGAPPDATGSVAILVPNVDLGDGGNRTVRLADGQAPEVRSAEAVSREMIRVVLSEPVVVPGGEGAAPAWSVSGPPGAGGLNASYASGAPRPAAPAAALVLLLDGGLPGGTAPPAGLALLYDPARGNVSDPAGNALAAARPTGIGDGIAPEVESSLVAGPNEAVVSYSEPARALPGAYRSVALADGSGDRPVAGLGGNETETHTIAFGGGAAAPGAEGTLRMDGAAVIDLAGNRLGPGPAELRLRDGQGQGPIGADLPEPLSVSVLRRAGGDPVDSAASYTAGQDIAVKVRFTAPVDVDTAGGAPYLELRTGSAGARAAYASGSGTDALEFSYTVRGGDITGRLSYAGTDALYPGGGAIEATTGSGMAASVVLPEPGAPGSLSAPGSPAVRIDPEPGRPVLDVGVLDDEGAGSAGRVREAALAAAYAFNEEQGRADGALLLNATAYGAGGTTAAVAGPAAAAAALQAAHAGGAGPSAYVGPSTDRGLHAAMPYAAASGIILVSAGSTAPSLAVEDDTVFRFLPGGRLDAEALARLARTAGAQSMVAVLENATHGPPTAAGSSLDDATPPPQDRFSRAFDAALAYAGVPTLSGTIALEGAAGGGGGPYEAAAAAEALDAAVQAARSAPVAVVYTGSPDGLAALAAASASYPALASAAWIASGASANSSLLAGDGPAAAFAAQAGLEAVRWSIPASGLSRAVDSFVSPGADAGARHRAYAAYDAMTVIGTAAAAAAAAETRGDTPAAAAVAELIPGAAAAYDGALGDIALDYAGDLWVPAVYDLWTVGRPGGAGTAAEWTQEQGALDETRACSIALTRAKIDYGPIDSGQTSRPHLQTIVNTGQLSFSRVDLTATPWHVDSPGGCAPGNMQSLPVGLSEIRTVQGGTFSDLAGTGTVLAQGLEAGSRSPLWYRLSLAGYADLPQAEITQCATYVVRCG